jgi:hypothetical protein
MVRVYRCRFGCQNVPSETRFPALLLLLEDVTYNEAIVNYNDLADQH